MSTVKPTAAIWKATKEAMIELLDSEIDTGVFSDVVAVWAGRDPDSWTNEEADQIGVAARALFKQFRKMELPE